jgi:hypothetical protein
MLLHVLRRLFFKIALIQTWRKYISVVKMQIFIECDDISAKQIQSSSLFLFWVDPTWIWVPFAAQHEYTHNTIPSQQLKLSSDSGDSGSYRCKQGYGSAHGGAWQSPRLERVWSQAVSFVLVRLAGIWLQSPW